MKAIIFDVETTGLTQPAACSLAMQPHIIEIGAMYIDDDVVTRTISQLLNPGDKIYDDKLKHYSDKIPAIASKINGIDKEMLIDKPTFSDQYFFIREFFKGADMLIAHNAKFDVSVLEFELKRIPVSQEEAASNHIDFPWPPTTICTVHEYKAMMGKWPKMTELYQKIMGKPLEQTHRALDDCVALHEILVKDEFFEKIKESE